MTVILTKLTLARQFFCKELLRQATSTLFWDLTQCRFGSYRHFGTTDQFPLRGLTLKDGDR